MMEMKKSEWLKVVLMGLLFAICFLHSVDCQQENDRERQLLDLCNVERSKVALRPLRFNQQLFLAAHNFAKLMATENFFAHTGPDGSTVSQRISAAGYSQLSSSAELMARDQTPEAVLTAWMDSPGHRSIILDASLEDVGVGEAANIWVMVLASKFPTPTITPTATPTTPTTTATATAPTSTSTSTAAGVPAEVVPQALPSAVSIFYFQGRNFELFKTKAVGQLEVNNPSGKPFYIDNQLFSGKDWSAKFFGYFRAPVTGVYHFQTISDDGVILTLGGERLINNWTTHKPTTTNSGAVQLTAGATYSLKVEYFNGEGGATLHVLYQTPGSDNFVRLPPNLLVPDSAATQSS